MLARFNSRHLLFSTAALLGAAGLAAHAAAPTTIQRVSVSPTGQEGNADVSGRVSLSADGRFVSFTSLASNLWANGTADHAGFNDIFTRDRASNFTFFESIAQNPLGGALSNYINDGDSINPALSEDGKFIAFTSDGSGLVFAATNAGTNQVYLRDRRGSTIIASRASGTAGAIGNNASDKAQLTADGKTVVYQSQASNLITGDTNGLQDIFQTKVTIVPPPLGVGNPTVTLTTTRVDTPPVTPGQAATESNGDSSDPSISPDGRFITFTSDASNLVANDNNGQTDVFLKDNQTGKIELISVATDGTQGDGASGNSAVSADGRFVAFTSDATNLVDGDLNSAADVFVRDRATGVTERISNAPDGTESDGDSGIGTGRPRISDDGRFVVFSSTADNLDPADSNGVEDIFVVDRALGTIARVNLDASGAEADDVSSSPAISGDGSTIAFISSATNLVPDKTTKFVDAYVVANPLAGSGSGNGGAGAPDIVIDAPAEVNEGDAVVLDASGSTDPGGASLTFVWTQVAQTGVPQVTLTGANTAVAQFTAPQVLDSTTFTFQVAVSDGTHVSTDTVEVVVDPLLGGVLTGRVTDVNGNAIVGAVVDVVRNDGATATEVETDGNGNYEVDDVPVGQDTVTVTPPDTTNLEPASASFTITVMNGEPGTANQDFVLSTPAATLSGVVQLANGQVVSGAEVTLTDKQGNVVASASTDDAGEYHLQGIRRSAISGGLTLTINASGLAPWTVSSPSITASTDNTLNFRYGVLVVTVDGSPKSLRSQLNGTTVDLLVGGQVFTSATVNKKTRKVTFRDVPATTVRVRASNAKLAGAVQDVTVNSGSRSTSVTLFLKKRGGFVKPSK